MALNLSLTIFYGFSIRGDSTPKEKMPRDGTVFQLTSNVILFLQQINEFVDTLAMILTQDTSYNQVCVENKIMILPLFKECTMFHSRRYVREFFKKHKKYLVNLVL